MSQSSPLAPGLYLVATPIGNLADMSRRATETLERTALILAEDTRVTGRLLKHLGVATPMLALHDHNETAMTATIVPRLAAEAIALVSDAGTPLISDPGFRLVRAARDVGLAVFAVPGPCAAVAALAVSGLPADRFLFAGFLPPKAAARDAAIAELAAIPATLVFYESPYRLAATLAALADGLGDRPAAVCRELTKLFEETVAAPLSVLAARYADVAPRGEIVVVVGPPLPPPPASADLLDSALADLPADAPLNAAAAAIALRLGLPKRQVYARALALRRGVAL